MLTPVRGQFTPAPFSHGSGSVAFVEDDNIATEYVQNVPLCGIIVANNATFDEYSSLLIFRIPYDYI